MGLGICSGHLQLSLSRSGHPGAPRPRQAFLLAGPLPGTSSLLLLDSWGYQHKAAPTGGWGGVGLQTTETHPLTVWETRSLTLLWFPQVVPSRGSEGESALCPSVSSVGH